MAVLLVFLKFLAAVFMKISGGTVPVGFGVGGVEGREAGLRDIDGQAAVPGDVEAVVVGRHEVGCGGGVFHRF